MKYNPKAKLDDEQIKFKRARASGHTFADRFSAMAEKNVPKSESKASLVARDAMKRRLQKRGDWLGP